MTLDDIRAAVGRMDSAQLAALDELLQAPDDALPLVVLDEDRDVALARYFQTNEYLPATTIYVSFESAEAAVGGSIKTERASRLNELLNRRR
ncbi:MULTISPECIES: hypothetical protein [unclassified Caballeronia]|uniref:hypothetical protein n=1 Tax=unclassified Caballeronia TaxID=2646786 RepID=UPI002028A59C|nr:MULTISPECIES: hypothetical protein [unclassified Caballeronia]